MELAQYSPIILTVVCILIAVTAHWKFPARYWMATTVSATIMVLVVLGAMLFVEGSFYFKVVADSGEEIRLATLSAFISSLVFFHGFAVSALAGIVMRRLRPKQVREKA